MSMDAGAKPTKGKSKLTGLSKEIYEIIEDEFVKEPIDKFEESASKGVDESMVEELSESILKKNKLLCYAISKAVINHIVNNMEIVGIKCKIDTPSVISTVPPGALVTTPMGPGAVSSPTTANGNVTNPKVSQINNGTGLVK